MAISLGQLDLEALKNYLKIVQGFRTVNDPAMDTEYVDGVAANFIAIASLINNELLKDENGKPRRDVVNHALNVLRLDENGKQTIINANDLLTLQQGEGFLEDAIDASENTAEDMRQLRNEMYHLKTKMIRSGSVTYDQVYNGWIDPFIHYIEDEDAMDGRFTKDTLTLEGLQSGGDITPVGLTPKLYNAGQFAVLLSEGNAAYANEISSVDESTIYFKDGSFFLDKIPDTIQKSYGMYHNGQFVFANDVSNILTTENSVNMIYKDGASRVKILEFNETEDIYGFGTMIEAPAELDENYLNAIGISLRAIGKPGQIWCELYHYNDEAVYDPEYIIATSEFKNSDTITTDWKTHKFFFRDTAVRLESGHKYLLLIKATGTFADNVFCLGGFKEICNTAAHQDTFLHHDNAMLERVLPDLTTNEIYDAFVSLYTTESQQVVLNYSRYGIYTGTFELENAQASRVRVSFNPNLNGRQNNPELFKIEEYYSVNAIGFDKSGAIVYGVPDGTVKKYSHVVVSNNEVSADEYAYDFIFGTAVTKIEFQIMYHSPDVVDENKHGSLFSVVVSTDNAYIKE